MKKYIIYHGSNKNIGDFLIKERAKQLIKFHKNAEFVEINTKEDITPYIKTMNESDAIIIPGGPGVKHNEYKFYESLLKNIDKIKCPIYSLGVGYDDFPGTEYNLAKYKLHKKTKKLYGLFKKIGVRDYYSKRVLNKNGLNNVVMAGCPVFYDVNSIGKHLQIPDKIRKIAFTTSPLGGQKRIYLKQNISIMKMLKKKFPKAEFTALFNRGIKHDEKSITKEESKKLVRLAEECKKLSFKVVDMSYDVNKADMHKEFDLHIGYRLHAHLHFMSIRKPSILMVVDGRGVSVCETLATPYVRAFKPTLLNSIIEIIIPISFAQELAKYLLRSVKPNPLVNEQLSSLIDEEIENNFNRVDITNKIDNYYTVMIELINELP